MAQLALKEQSEVIIDAGGVGLLGNLVVPARARGMVVFAHGSGSSRFSRRNQFVAESLNERDLGTLLFDLLTPEENRVDQLTRQLRFDIDLLRARLCHTLDWVGRQPACQGLPIGLFGASTGAAAAIAAAAERPQAVRAVVSRGGRPDLAGDALPRLQAPVLLIVGGDDEAVIAINMTAARAMRAEHRLEVVPAATHLFEEPGKLEEVARLAGDWFSQRLKEEG